MSLILKSAVAVALLSAASMASFAGTVSETIPGNGPVPNPGLTDGSLMLEVLDINTNHYDTVNLGSGLGAFKTLATATGTTYDFGVISNFSTLFSSTDVSSGSVQFLVASGNSVTSGHTEGLVTLSSPPTSVANGAVHNFTTAMGTAIGPFNNATACNGVNPCGATSTSDIGYNPALATLNTQSVSQQIIGLGQSTTSGTVGSATGLEFYDILQTGVLGNGKLTDLNGAWSISATGDVTYTVAGGSAPPPVPLPAAVWLLGSGLLGLAGVGRRKKTA